MRKTSEDAHRCRQIPSRLGRRDDMSASADAGKFSLAHVVAFQHAILHTIPGGDGTHQQTNFEASAVSPRESVHAFYNRCAAGLIHAFGPPVIRPLSF